MGGAEEMGHLIADRELKRDQDEHDPMESDLPLGVAGRRRSDLWLANHCKPL